MKISFVGHSHHRVTRSSGFFTQILESLGTVDYAWDETWRGQGPADITSVVADAELVVVWQSVAYIKRIVSLQHPNVVYVPMFDACRQLRRSFWRSLKATKVLNFSSTLHQRIQVFGVRSSAYFQYFPNPDEQAAVSDFSSLRGFFWQRQPRPNWNDVKMLIGPEPFDSFHLHLAPDPDCREFSPPSESERRTWNVQVSDWFPDKKDLLERLGTRNVYFAPRLDEGIGLSFLEAMAMGMAVCAHNSPTHSEYIVDGINGFLYTLDRPAPPRWENAEAIGQRARASVEKGHSRWRADRQRLLEFLAEPAERGSARRYARTFTTRLPPAVEDVGSTGAASADQPLATEGGKRINGGAHAGPTPLVTVATVVRNSAAELSSTLASILGQTYPAKEVVVVDGGSDDETLSVIRQHSGYLDYWCSEPDGGPYDAMNKAADIARGRWIIYINAGDTFVDDGALARFVSGVPQSADFVAGHHVYISPDGVEEIHRCTDFERTYRKLLDGDTDGTWLGGIPGHQSVLTRVDLIRKHRYDLSYRIAADHEFLYRMRRHGASFHIEPIVVSQYVGGGLSWKNLLACLEEWRAIALRYTDHKTKVERHFRRLLVDSIRYRRRTEALDWRRDPARSHPWLAVLVELEFRMRQWLDRLDTLYARLTTR